jgi:hypothetical protein
MEVQATENEWQRISCLGDQISLMLPFGWARPYDEVTEKKFPYHSKPQEIFADDSISRLMTFNMLEKQLQNQQVYPAIREIQKVIVHMYPESVREPARKIASGIGEAAYFSYITGGVKEDCGHIMFVIPVHEKMMLGSYHFPAVQLNGEREVFLEILQSMQVNEDTEGRKQ